MGTEMLEPKIELDSLELDQVCRGCLNNGELKSIDSQIEEINEILLGEMFVECTSVPILENDGLPNQLCDYCIFQLTQAYLFKKECLKIDETIRFYVTNKFAAIETVEDSKIINETKIETLDDLDEKLIDEVFDKDSSETEVPKETKTRNKNRERNYQCEDCERTFFTASHLKSHRYVHTNERPYKCVDCDRTFRIPGALKRHLKMHQEGCNETQEIPKKSHRSGKFKLKDKIFLCSACGKSFSTRTKLIVHDRIHTGEKPYSCESCDKSFPGINSLRSHMTIHTGEKKFDCSVCAKPFRHRHVLKQHLLIHMGIKKYACTYCSKSFTQKSHLRYHLRTHTGEKPYQCDICSTAFALKWNLTSHRRTHTGEKPYICLVCAKRFSDSGLLARHRKTHRK